jgi:hypothetical protein
MAVFLLYKARNHDSLAASPVSRSAKPRIDSQSGKAGSESDEFLTSYITPDEPSVVP